VLVRYEDGISWYIVNNMALKVRDLHISPQHVINKVDGDKSTAVDFYVNGKLKTFFEVVRDSDRLENHFKKFADEGGYVSNNNWGILDILTEGVVPAINKSTRGFHTARQHEDKLFFRITLCGRERR
jgi:hypothetical protein